MNSEKSDKKRSCFWIFKLHTGVAILCYLDLWVFVFACISSGILIDPKDDIEEDLVASEDNLEDPTVEIERSQQLFEWLKPTSFRFNLVTDWLMIILFAIKIKYALKYFYSMFSE